MSKHKKITIKPFLNQKLEPLCSDADGKEYYPLYIQVTYDRKNTQIRSKYGMYYDSINDPMLLNLKEFESKLLYKIIEYETMDTNKPYDLKGLKTRYDIYSVSIRLIIGDYLKIKLKRTLLRTNSELMFVLNFEQSYFETLYKASQLLFKKLPDLISAEFKQEIDALTFLNKLRPDAKADYDFPTIIDWKDGSFKSIFEKKLSQELKDKKDISETIKLMDRIINARLKNITETL